MVAVTIFVPWQLIEGLLDTHGDNIQAAIEQLHQLRLSSSNGEEQQGHALQQEIATNPESGMHSQLNSSFKTEFRS